MMLLLSTINIRRINMENKLENLHDVNKVMAIIKTLEEKKASNENFPKIE